jgi:hypothetical protein
MITVAIMAMLLAAEPGSQVASGQARDQSALLSLPSADEDIRRDLFEALARNPEQRVCTNQTLTGSRQPRRTCGTLQHWFAERTSAEVQAREAPWQLVEEIKRQRRKANVRARGGA